MVFCDDNNSVKSFNICYYFEYLLNSYKFSEKNLKAAS